MGSVTFSTRMSVISMSAMRLLNVFFRVSSRSDCELVSFRSFMSAARWPVYSILTSPSSVPSSDSLNLPVRFSRDFSGPESGVLTKVGSFGSGGVARHFGCLALHVVVDLHLRLVRLVDPLAVLRPELRGAKLFILRVVDEHPRAHRVLGRHERLLAEGRDVRHRRAVVAVLLLLEGRVLAVEGLRAHAVGEVRAGVGLDVILDEADWDVARKLQSVVIAYRVGAPTAPAVLDDRARLDARHGERLGLHLQSVGLDDRALEDVFLLQLDYRAVGLDGAARDVRDLDLAPADLRGEDVNLALRLAPAVVEDFDSDVVLKYRARLAAVGLVGDLNLPEEGLGVGVALDGGRAQRKLRRVNRLPVLVAAREGRRGGEGEREQTDERRERSGAREGVWGFHLCEPFEET